ncbi:MAG: hypothetical protein HQ461_01425 [Deltaproteobacteria bacterium]|nr:hypothetical protein [Deltaproteobacteria bacterium]
MDEKKRIEGLEAAARAKAAAKEREQAADLRWRVRVKKADDLQGAQEQAMLDEAAAFAARVAAAEPAFRKMVSSAAWKRLATATDGLFGRPPRLANLFLVQDEEGLLSEGSLTDTGERPVDGWWYEWHLGSELTLTKTLYSKFYGKLGSEVVRFGSFAALGKFNEAQVVKNRQHVAATDTLAVLFCMRTLVTRVERGDLMAAVLLQAEKDQ